MDATTGAAGRWARVWIVAPDEMPLAASDIPRRATVLFALSPGCVELYEAREIAAGFNEAMLRAGERRWAIARPVSLRFENDLQEGQRIGDD